MGQLLSPDFVSPKTSLGTHKTSISRIDHIVGMFYIISIYCICHFHRILVPDPRFPDPTDRAMICWDLGSLGSGICWDPIIGSSQIESRIGSQIVQLFSINCRIFLGIFLFSNPHWQAQGSESNSQYNVKCSFSSD